MMAATQALYTQAEEVAGLAVEMEAVGEDVEGEMGEEEEEGVDARERGVRSNL